MNISVNPMLIMGASGIFAGPSSDGIVQGVSFPDPATIWQLRTGTLAATETLPMWGGLPLVLDIPGVAGGPAQQLGPTVKRAVAGGPVDAFSVFDQAYGMISSPASPVPSAGIGMQVESFRMGGGARIGVQCTAAVANLGGSDINTPVQWDFVNNQLDVLGSGTALPVKVLATQIGNSMTVVYNAGTGFLTWNFNGTAAIIQI